MRSSSSSSSSFTLAQWQELEHQALVFKYIVAGHPVPPDLVLPLQNSFNSPSHKLFDHRSSGFGKKVDPEPGRCRRTDGKKWRCSKEAHPDSKYCEHHMHRGRNRSRKPVESSLLTNSTTYSSSSSSSTLTSSSSFTVSNARNRVNKPPSAASMNCNQSTPFGFSNKGYRYMQAEHGFFSEASGMSLSLENSYPQTSSFFNIDFSLGGPAKHDDQSLRPLFDEWPKTRASLPDLEDKRSKQTTTTQLFIPTPMASSGFSAANSHSSHEAN